MKLRNMTSIYLTKGDKILLLYRQGGRVVNNVWIGSAGGHFEQDELNDPRACVLRELKEEVGLTEENLEHLRLRYLTLRNAGDELRQNYYFFAELKESIPEHLSSNEGRLQWFSNQELRELDMPVAAKHMINHYLDYGLKNGKLYCGVVNGDKSVFSELSEC